MTYKKSDFEKLASLMAEKLIPELDAPLSCRLHDFSRPNGHHLAKFLDGLAVEHVASACNLATSIQGIFSILTLPQNDTDCERLSRVLVRELGSLREAIKDAIEEQDTYEKIILGLSACCYVGSPEEKNIRLWADTLKHPSSTIVAHQCFTEDDNVECVIDTAKLRILEKEMETILESDPTVANNSSKAWRKVWEMYSGKTVKFSLPSVDEIARFLTIIEGRLVSLIKRSEVIAKSDC